MTDNQKQHSISANIISVLAAIVISGACWYFGNAFSGDYWYLVWIAPVPVIYWSLRLSAKAAFLVSFVAYLIGRLSWFSFLVSVATLVPAIVFTLIIPLFFSVIILLARRAVLRSAKWWGVFAFPVLWTAFEFLVLKYSPDGAAGIIANSQSDVTALIQVASVTGIMGITFIITLFPSAIALAWYYRQQKNMLIPLITVPFAIILSVLLFGITRLKSHKDGLTIKAGAVVLEEKFHHITNHPVLKDEIETTERYSEEIKKLATAGVQLVVLPERAININAETDSAVMSILKTTASQNRVSIVTGYTNFRNSPDRNSALVIDSAGNVVKDYNKVHLVTGLENQFTPGKEICLFQSNNTSAGLAICKDLDFPYYIRQYGTGAAKVLFIPAWDFVKDDWLHARMAILRGVENGFAEVRSARQGRLTISDATGRVTSEASSAKEELATLSGEVQIQNRDTLYVRFGDWFGILILVVAIFFILFPAVKKE